MYKMTFFRQNSSGVYQSLEESNSDLSALINTVFTNVEDIDKHHFLEDLSAKLYKQVDSDWVLQTSGDDYDAVKTKWDTMYND